MLLRPLFFTAWLLEDFLAEADMFGADFAVVSSASSRTASALAYLLSQRGQGEVVGLTSARAEQFTKDLGVYGAVLSYGSIVYSETVLGYQRKRLSDNEVIGAILAAFQGSRRRGDGQFVGGSGRGFAQPYRR